MYKSFLGVGLGGMGAFPTGFFAQWLVVSPGKD
jgi:hypothetical protein